MCMGFPHTGFNRGGLGSIVLISSPDTVDRLAQHGHNYFISVFWGCTCSETSICKIFISSWMCMYPLKMYCTCVSNTVLVILTLLQ